VLLPPAPPAATAATAPLSKYASVGQQQQCKPRSTVSEEEEEEAQRVLGSVRILSTCQGAPSVFVKLKLRARM
jgi:hypothetical protein